MEEKKYSSTLKHIEGINGLKDAFEYISNSIISSSETKTKKKKYLLIFDFDRTLTNGFATPSETSINKRVRGGQTTIDAFNKISSLIPKPFYIVTARSPTVLVIEQLLASLSGPQQPLSPFFLNVLSEDITSLSSLSSSSDNDSNNNIKFTKDPIEIIKHHGRYIAYGGPNGRLYASDMEKGTAISHILTRLKADENEKNDFDEVEIHFFDDNILNIHSVASIFEEGGDWIGEKSGYYFDVSVNCWWWDSFEEEFGIDKPTMVPCPSTSSDFNYQPHLTPILIKMGLAEEIISKRKDIYKKREKEILDNKPADQKEKEEPKPKIIGKLKLPNENTLAIGGNFLLNRKPPP